MVLSRPNMHQITTELLLKTDFSFNLSIHNFIITKAESCEVTSAVERTSNYLNGDFRSLSRRKRTPSSFILQHTNHFIMSLSFEIAIRLSNVRISTAGESFILRFEIQTKFHSLSTNEFASFWEEMNLTHLRNFLSFRPAAPFLER